MKVTAQWIADQCGVSRGTVDRVVNGRPNVSPEVRERIQKLISEYGYKTPTQRQAARAGRGVYRIGVILPSWDAFFIRRMRDGIRTAVHNRGLNDVTVLVEELKNRSPRSYFEAIGRMEERGIDGLIVTAPDTLVMREEIDRLVASGVPVVTCDSDVCQSRRLYHIGQDMVKSGRVAAGLIAPYAEGGEILVVTGNREFAAHDLRVRGFLDRLHELRGDDVVVNVIESVEKYELTYDGVLYYAKGHPRLRGIYMANESVRGCMDALERVHAAAHGLVRHVDAAQTRMTLRIVQHAVIGQLVLFDALDDVHDHVVAAQLVQPVEKTAHAQVMRRKLAVARNDEDLAALRIGRDQSRRDAARLYHILTDVIQSAALADVRVAGHNRHAGGDQTVDLLAHDERVGRGNDQAVDAALLHAADRLEVRARRTVLQLLDQHGHVVQAAVVHRGADAVAHAADEERIPARQDDADAVHAAARPGRLPLRRCFVAVFADQLLNALAHLGRDVRTAVYHAVYRSARYAALIRDPLCSYLHSRNLPFTLSCIFSFTA